MKKHLHHEALFKYICKVPLVIISTLLKLHLTFKGELFESCTGASFLHFISEGFPGLCRGTVGILCPVCGFVFADLIKTFLFFYHKSNLNLNSFCQSRRYNQLFSFTFNTLTADVEPVLTADFKDDTLFGFTV